MNQESNEKYLDEGESEEKAPLWQRVLERVKRNITIMTKGPDMIYKQHENGNESWTPVGYEEAKRKAEFLENYGTPFQKFVDKTKTTLLALIKGE
ncbi:hypothetical protein K9L63_00940 [Candidatus Gracilibacteria bacterium]|nr:hypothetical protein [Candidatus Gracilibacteria bacterium]